MDLGLTNKNVLVTGASQGIGSAIAERFLEEGAKVIIVSRGSKKLFDLENLLKATYGNDSITAEVCDCTSRDELKDLKKRLNISHGKIDIVIANVGNGAGVPDAMPEHEVWKESWKVNFESGLFTAEVFLSSLEKSNGSLLFISSIAAKEAFGAPVDYSTAKTALLALGKNMARKLGDKIRVNVLAPGNILFEGGSWEKKIKENNTRVNEIIEKSVPMKRFGSPNEIADSAVFLSSERASFITGSVLVVDGGQTVSVF